MYYLTPLESFSAVVAGWCQKRRKHQKQTMAFLLLPPGPLPLYHRSPNLPLYICIVITFSSTNSTSEHSVFFGIKAQAYLCLYLAYLCLCHNLLLGLEVQKSFLCLAVRLRSVRRQNFAKLTMKIFLSPKT